MPRSIVKPKPTTVTIRQVGVIVGSFAGTDVGRS